MSNTITLFLMTEKGYRVLEAVSARYPEAIDRVVSCRDAHVDQDFYDEIQTLCETKGIAFEDRQDVSEVTSSHAMAVSWRWLINLPETELVVFHDSLLPRYRGFAPLVAALVNGDERIGVTALFAADNYDQGDIIAQLQASITYPIKIQAAIELLIDCYCQLAMEISDKIVEGSALTGTPQDDTQATYSLWRDDDDYAIDWSQTATRIKRFIDAVGVPYAGASTNLADRKARVLEAEVVSDVGIEHRTPGKVIFMESGSPVVVCGQGLLRITDLRDVPTGNSLLPLSTFRLRFG